MHAPPSTAEENDQDADEACTEERIPTLAEKLFLLFEDTHPDVDDVRIQPIWVAGELLRFGGNFNKYVQACNLVKQEGIFFRHLLRLILLCSELAQLCPADISPEAWREDLHDLAERLTASCRAVDPQSTDELMDLAKAADIIAGEETENRPSLP